MNGVLQHSRTARYPNTPAGKLAHQLGWFSIALGVMALLASRRVAHALGMNGQERLIRAYGVRELGKGIGLLSSPNPAPWLWGRVAGDALDLGTLAYAYQRSPNRGTIALALANVATVIALDVFAAQQLQRTARRQQLPARYYSQRSGFPRGVEAARGQALRPGAGQAAVPNDFKIPEPLRPLA